MRNSKNYKLSHFHSTFQSKKKRKNWIGPQRNRLQRTLLDRQNVNIKRFNDHLRLYNTDEKRIHCSKYLRLVLKTGIGMSKKNER